MSPDHFEEASLQHFWDGKCNVEAITSL